MATRGPHQFAGSDLPGEAYFGPLPPHSGLEMRGYHQHHQPPYPFGMLDVPLGFLPGEALINDTDPCHNLSPRFPQVAQIAGRQTASVYGGDQTAEQSQYHQMLNYHHQYEDLAGILGDSRVASGNFSEAATSVVSEQQHVDGTGSSRNSSLGEHPGPRLKFMCSFGGKILPRPGDGKLRYAGGETRIVSLRRNTTYADLMHKMLQLCGQPVYLKYQLPDEDLDALITVSSDEDLENMMEEYDRLEASENSSRLRIFLFSPAENEVVQFSDPSESRSTEQVYVEAINGISETAAKRYNDAAIGANSSEVPVTSITSRVPATLAFPASEGNSTVSANPSAAVFPTAVRPAVPKIPSAPLSSGPLTSAFLHASQGIPSIIPDISAGFLDQPIKRPMAVLDGAYQMVGSGAPTPVLSHQQSSSQGSNGSPRVPYQETSRGLGNMIDQLYQFEGLQIGDPTVAGQGAMPISGALNDPSYANNNCNLLPLGGHQISHGAIYSAVDSQVSAAPLNFQSLASQASSQYQRANLVQHPKLDSSPPHEQLLTTANLPSQMAYDFAAFRHLGEDGTSVMQPAEKAFPAQMAVNPSVPRPVKTVPISPIGSAPTSPRLAYKETVFTQTGVAQQNLAAIQGGPGGSAEQSHIGLPARGHLVSWAKTSSTGQIANQQPIGPPTNVETIAQRHQESLMNPHAAGRIYDDGLTSALEAEGLIGHPGNKDGLRKMLQSKDEEMRRELQQTNWVEMEDQYPTSDQIVSNKRLLNDDVMESTFGKFGMDKIDSHEHAKNEFDHLANIMASEANGTMEPSAAIGQLPARPNVDQVQNGMPFSGDSLLNAYTPSPTVQPSLSSNSGVHSLSDEKFMDEVSLNSSSPLSLFPLKMTSNAVSSQSLFLSNMEEGQLIGNLMSYLDSNDNDQQSNKNGSDYTINLIGEDGHIKSSSGNMTGRHNESFGSEVSNISKKGSSKSLIDEDVFVPSDSYGRTDSPLLSNDPDSSTMDPFAKLVASSYTRREAVTGNDKTHTGLMGTSGIFPFSQVQAPEVLEDKTLLPIYDSDSVHASENADCENEEIRENLEHVAKNVAAAVLQPVLYSSPTLSIQNWEDTLAESNLGGDSVKSNTSLNKAHSEVKPQHHDKGVTFQLDMKEGDEDGVRTDELTNLATIAEAEAKGRGLQIIKYSDLEELRELGSGTFGTVYHGKWRGTDVAIKRIKSSCFTGRPSERERLIADFWQEACILEKLHHPNVVAFYGVVPDGPGGTLATVTEYMVNGSLKQVLQKQERTMDRRKRLLITMDAAFGMEYLHGKNIVHFDLKCENLLVNLRDPQRPICKVADLGLSKVKHKTMISGGVRGTLPWMAPELLNGSIVSEKVDVFSFGIVMWELLTGEEPYANMHYGAIIGGIASNTLRPPVPSWCDSSWKSLMEWCWSADPEDRPSFTDIAAELRTMSSNLKAQAQTTVAASGS